MNLWVNLSLSISGLTLISWRFFFQLSTLEQSVHLSVPDSIWLLKVSWHIWNRYTYNHVSILAQTYEISPKWPKVQFSSVASDSLRPHESQYTRPPCPSPTPRVHSDSRPLRQWCYPAISSSIVPFSSCPQSLPASESFPMSQLFAWSGQSTGVLALTSFLPKKSQGWSPSEWTGWISLQSKGPSRVFNTTVQKHPFFSAQPSSQSNSHIHTWPRKNQSLD